jgi:hypothetical protein
MTSEQHATLVSQCDDAIRAITVLDTLEGYDPRDAVNRALHDARQAYVALYTLEQTVPLTHEATINVQYILDRLSTQMRCFGEII